MAVVVFGGDTPMGAALVSLYQSQGRATLAVHKTGDGWIVVDPTDPASGPQAAVNFESIDIDFVVFAALTPDVSEGGLPIWIEAFSQNALAIERVVQMTRAPMSGAEMPRFVVVMDTPRRAWPQFDVVRGAGLSQRILASARSATKYSAQHRLEEGAVCAVYYHPDYAPDAEKPLEISAERMAPPLAKAIDELTLEHGGLFEQMPIP